MSVWCVGTSAGLVQLQAVSLQEHGTPVARQALLA